MQYTPHYNLKLPEGTDIVNPLVQDNPNYSAIDTALYDNKLRVVGTATHVKTDTNHAITLADSDINQFKFVATGDYVTGDTFTVDGVTVTPRIADGSTIPNGAFKINSTVLCILDGTMLNLANVDGTSAAGSVTYDNASSGLASTDVQGAIDELASGYTFLGNGGALTPIALPSEFKELLIITGRTTSMYEDCTSGIIPKDIINPSGTTRRNFIIDSAFSGGSLVNWRAQVSITNAASIQLNSLYAMTPNNATDASSNGNIWVYYR